MDAISRFDAALLADLPVVAQPLHSALPELAVGKRRLIVGRQYQYLEVRAPALHACLPVGECYHVLPYGEVTPFVRLEGGPIPIAMREALIEAALSAHPNETARLVTWDGHRYALERPQEEAAGTGHVTYRDDVEDRALVVDLHSHGAVGAYFSATDDESDLSRPGPYIAIVVGTCQSRDRATMAARLVSGPFLVPLSTDELLGDVLCA